MNQRQADWKIEKILYKGKNSVVYAGILDGSQVVYKTHRQENRSKEQRKRLSKDYELGSSINCPQVIKYIKYKDGVFMEDFKGKYTW